MVKAISRARKELTEKKAKEVFESEHEQKRRDLQSRLEEAARRMWDYDRNATLRRTVPFRHGAYRVVYCSMSTRAPKPFRTVPLTVQ